ncbi:S8 family peptidase [Alkalihalophilus pseudofirmus]|uniref:S8 family peptidase n=1 Tax=Alkalihalophilus pseudofirmus TaxID=79885 RepID=UPI001EE493A0
MKSLSIGMVFFLLLFFFSATPVFGQDAERYMVTFEGAIDTELIEDAGGEVHETIELIQAASATLPKENVSGLLAHEEVAAIEIDQEVEITSVYDWGTNTIQAPAAWANGIAGDGVRVAVIDTGVDFNHNDLTVIDSVSFVQEEETANDENGHGTHVAGIIAANGTLLGTAPNSELYVVKALDKNGTGFHSNVVKGIEWALERDIDVINLSIGGNHPSRTLEQAIQKAYENGVLLVAAGGNNGTASGSEPTVEYPAKYEQVIAVAATDANDNRASFSATGPEIEVSAPGVGVISTYLNGGHARMSGTSMAAPHVSGHLALLKQAYPNATNGELRSLLHEQTVSLSGEERSTFYGYGRIQVSSDLTLQGAPLLAPVTEGSVVEETKVELHWSPHPDSRAVAKFRIYRDNQLIFETAGTYFTENMTAGTYAYHVTAVDSAGVESSAGKQVVLTVESAEEEPVTPTEPAPDPQPEPSPQPEPEPSPLPEPETDESEPVLEPVPESLPEPDENVEQNPVEIPVVEPGPTAAEVFKDLEGSEWFAPALEQMYQQGIVMGFPDETIRPQARLNRADTIIMLTRALGIQPVPYQDAFSDVGSSHYAASFLQAAFENNLTAGYPDGTFGVGDMITRGEVAVLLSRSYTPPRSGGEAPVFTDVSEGYFGAGAIRQLTEAGVISGYPDASFRPHAPITRAEFAALLSRLL